MSILRNPLEFIVELSQDKKETYWESIEDMSYFHLTKPEMEKLIQELTELKDKMI